MKVRKISIDWNLIAGVFRNVLFLLLVVFVSMGLYNLGFSNGFGSGFSSGSEEAYGQIVSSAEESGNSAEGAIRITNETPLTNYQSPSWSGPELWEEINTRRLELGVNSLSTKSELCTIASIRLNQLLDLGTLDGHEGFGVLSEEREDLLWIFEKYNLSEFLVAGAESPKEAVSLWENTLGHKKLLTGGEYVWGCIYAQEGFGVAITAY